MARLYFDLKDKSDVTKLIRKEQLVVHPSSGKRYLVQFEIIPNKLRKCPESLDALYRLHTT